MTVAAVVGDVAAADRRAMKISLRLDSIAENFEAVLPMIRQAIELRDFETLGYNGVSDYVQDRFGGALTRLPVDLRRPVVHELSAAGMTTRAIAPVVGVDPKTIRNDLSRGDFSPPVHVDTETGEVSDDYPTAPRVTGLDGKSYPGRQTDSTPKAAPRRPLTDQFFDAAYDLAKVTERIERLAADDRFTQNAEKVAAKHRSDLIRARDLLQQVIDRLS